MTDGTTTENQISTHASSPFVDGYLAYLLAQASSRISREFHREVEASGLSVTEWRVIASLAGSDGESIGTLAQLALTKQPTLSKVVQRMEAEGLVERNGARRDRRQTLVRLTRKGRELADSLCARALRHQQAVLEPFGHDNAALLIGMLKDLIALHPPAAPADDGV
ncbi:MarR family winged helix-turn-helix transcriptional regulator [Aromatoleum evansii]|uniref:MarR family winged helix-turn-helix transcriptional regulator n=1 Tax=Aromatoleum evansii TaxID=59406 RepID=UPI00145C7ADA|nr:MarR family winged helix-turn-helix transcriptional regulator [Aromatoleum evansii]NMG27776.1 MarR family transcriptional regulator [Aromatoleum evansii]